MKLLQLLSSPKRRRRIPSIAEALEDRRLLTINIVYDYSYDTGGFFASADRQATMEAAARLFEQSIADSLTAITPSSPNSWTAEFPDPSTGTTVSLTNPSIPADEIRVYLGARPLSDNTIGFASTAYNASGTAGWLNTVQYRGQTPGNTEYAVWGGSITFDSENTWHTGVSTVGLTSGESDLYSTAIHELGHLLGYGGDSWDAQVTGGEFIGPVSTGVFGGNVPVTGGHWADGTTNDGREVNLSPIGVDGTRASFTTLDWAGLDDIGWAFRSATAPSGQIVVHVVDGDGNPLAGANVTGTRSGGGTFSGTTDAFGLYSSFVVDGSWTVSSDGDSETVTVAKGMEGIQLQNIPVVNGDDVFLWDSATGRWRIGFSDGSSFTQTLANSFSSTANWTMFQGDFDGNGQTDVLGLLPSGQLWVGASNGSRFTNSNWGQLDPAKTWSDLHVADFNNDGCDDLAGRDQDGYWNIAFSNGSGFVSTAAGRWAATGWASVVFGDFNGDGRADVAGRYASGDWYFGLSNGTSFVTTRVGKWSSSTNWSDVVTGDFDGDGKDDIAAQTSLGYWWIAKSSGVALANMYSGVRWSPSAGFHNVLTGDFNGDGRVDIAGRTASGSWFINQAKSVGTGFTVSGWGTWNNTLDFKTVVGDFNGDGQDDLAGYVASTRYWYILQSTGSRFSAKVFGRWSAGLTPGYVGAGTVN